jgi:hypothetical protein
VNRLETRQARALRKRCFKHVRSSIRHTKNISGFSLSRWPLMQAWLAIMPFDGKAAPTLRL